MVFARVASRRQPQATPKQRRRPGSADVGANQALQFFALPDAAGVRDKQGRRTDYGQGQGLRAARKNGRVVVSSENSCPPIFFFGRQTKTRKQMSQKSKELREKRAKICDDARILLEQKPLPEESRRKFDVMMAEADSLKVEIDREEAGDNASARWQSLDEELRRTTRPPEAAIGDGYGAAIDSRGQRRYEQAFRNFLRHGLTATERGGRGISSEDRLALESRDMGVASGGAGGYIVPQGFVYNVDVAMKFYGQMLQAGDIMDTATGNPLPWPTCDDSSISGEQIDENNPVNKQDFSLSRVVFGAFKYSTKMVPISLELVQDSAFDLDKFVAEQFGVRLGRILNNKFTLGVGSTEPLGIVTAATVGVAAASGSSGNTGGSETGANSIGTNDLVALEHSVDPYYRQGAAFMLHDSTLKSIKQLLDKYGRPIWQAGLSAGAPDTILGYRFYINNDMATITASAKTVLFGQLKKYKIRRVMDMRVLRLVERYADFGQIALLGFARYDGQLLDAGTHPVKVLVQHS